jgi:hypothetical protein
LRSIRRSLRRPAQRAKPTQSTWTGPRSAGRAPTFGRGHAPFGAKDQPSTRTARRERVVKTLGGGRPIVRVSECGSADIEAGGIGRQAQILELRLRTPRQVAVERMLRPLQSIRPHSLQRHKEPHAATFPNTSRKGGLPFLRLAAIIEAQYSTPHMTAFTAASRRTRARSGDSRHRADEPFLATCGAGEQPASDACRSKRLGPRRARLNGLRSPQPGMGGLHLRAREEDDASTGREEVLSFCEPQGGGPAGGRPAGRVSEQDAAQVSGPMV